MEPAELLRELCALAEEAGIAVRPLAGAGEGVPAASSGVCTVRGRLWVLLAEGDPPARRVAVLAAALRAHAGESLEGRYLPPAVRACLDAAIDPAGEAG